MNEVLFYTDISVFVLSPLHTNPIKIISFKSYKLITHTHSTDGRWLFSFRVPRSCCSVATVAHYLIAVALLKTDTGNSLVGHT